MTESAASALYRTIEHSAADPHISLPSTPRSTRFARSGQDPRELEDASTLSDQERRALETLLEWWPLPPPAGRARGLVDALCATELLASGSSRFHLRIPALERLAPAIDPDARWLAERGPFSMAALTEVRTLRADLSTLGTNPDLTSDPTLARAVILALSDAAIDSELSSFADRLRADLAERAVGLHLLDHDMDLIAKQRRNEDRHVSDPQFCRAMAAASRRGWSTLLKLSLGATPASGTGELNREDAVERLLNHAHARHGVEDPLVGGLLDELHDVSWVCVARIAGMPSLEERLAALLESRDWSSFDAPGEGDLPDIWRDALVVAGKWTPRWKATWLEHFGEEDDLDGAIETLRGYSDPEEEREASAHSSYSHGLHDGTAEAYGDVYSPHDPFSERKLERDPSREDD